MPNSLTMSYGIECQRRREEQILNNSHCYRNVVVVDPSRFILKLVEQKSVLYSELFSQSQSYEHTIHVLTLCIGFLCSRIYFKYRAHFIAH